MDPYRFLVKTNPRIGRQMWIKIVLIYFIVVCFIATIIITSQKAFTLLAYPSDFHVDEYLSHHYNKSHDFPQIIHHCWKNETIPDIWLPGYLGCINLNPNYTHLLWTHDKIDEFFRNEYAWFYDRFKAYKYRTQKLDVFRYFVLYHYGGIYLDLDLPCKVPFKTILSNIPTQYGMVIAEEWIVMLRTDFIATKQHHPLLKLAISNLPYAAEGYGVHYMDVMAGTGPYFFTRCLENYSDKKDVYHLPMMQWKWTYFDHPTSMFWASWYEIWLLNSWVGWLGGVLLSFTLVGMCVVRCR